MLPRLLSLRVAISTLSRVAPLLALAMLLALAPTAGRSQTAAPPLPSDVPEWRPDAAAFVASHLRPWAGVFAMGRATKERPLEVGEKIRAGATQRLWLERTQRDGHEVLARHVEVTRAGAAEPVVRGVIFLDPHSLVPLSSHVERQGQEIETEYAWDHGEVRQVVGDAAPTVESVTGPRLEAGVHDVWMGALPWDAAMPIRLPSMLGVGGGQYWMVPRVVGSENMDLGEGVLRETWVVELDWWGTTDEGYFPGGGTNGTAGGGGMYWVLKNPPEGVPPVVRIRTEIDADNDSVVQMQDGIEVPGA